MIPGSAWSALSYGGGIQLVTAAIDKRVDAIVPTIAWNNLNTSLAKNGAPKTSWGLLLTAALLLHGCPHRSRRSFPTLIDALLSGEVSPSGQDFLAARSPAISGERHHRADPIHPGHR